MIAITTKSSIKVNPERVRMDDFIIGNIFQIQSFRNDVLLLMSEENGSSARLCHSQDWSDLEVKSELTLRNLSTRVAVSAARISAQCDRIAPHAGATGNETGGSVARAVRG